ncbi:alpha/beta hydrolase fold protein [Microbacterium laevaniformans OR221]|jgi:pimeloyl-ACP methyl ester carboxylesterase|nr:alpha/beta hydrolase fold protein [Microbacterium laevaniformans OR221]
MRHVTSADGTRLAVHDTGSGPAVVIVNGALSTAKDAAALGAALADAGLRAITYDRRARGDSGDTKPFSLRREAEDLAAVIAGAGGEAAVLGHSSGAVIGLYAASLVAETGVPVRALFLSEPPFHFGVHEPAPDLPSRIQALVDAGDREEAVVLFQREAVGLPDAMIAQFRATDAFAGVVPLAQSTVYDATLARELSTPTDAMLAVDVPVTILCGEQTFPFLSAAAERLAAAMPHAELIVSPESVGHRLDAHAATRIVAARLA